MRGPTAAAANRNREQNSGPTSTFAALAGYGHGDDARRDVRQVQVEAVALEPLLLLGDQSSREGRHGGAGAVCPTLMPVLIGPVNGPPMSQCSCSCPPSWWQRDVQLQVWQCVDGYDLATFFFSCWNWQARKPLKPLPERKTPRGRKFSKRKKFRDRPRSHAHAVARQAAHVPPHT